MTEQANKNYKEKWKLNFVFYDIESCTLLYSLFHCSGVEISHMGNSLPHIPRRQIPLGYNPMGIKDNLQAEEWLWNIEPITTLSCNLTVLMHCLR